MPGATSVSSIFGCFISEHSSASVSVSAQAFGKRITAFSKTISISTTATIFFIACNCAAKLMAVYAVVNRINMCFYLPQNKRATCWRLFQIVAQNLFFKEITNG